VEAENERMTSELAVLLGTAVTLGFMHTVLGPDHYLPFIMMASAGRWSTAKTTIITALCGLGHILSSVVLGFIGIAFGLAVKRLEIFESVRGDIAAWLLIAFGFTYFIWGLHRAIRGKPHTHIHIHDSSVHSHSHSHVHEHAHVHKSPNMTPWILFTIFVFGPCEPLIPILMYPAARSSMGSVALVAGVFGMTTILTMLTLVLASSFGLARLPIKRLERYSHALAGLAVFLCGGAIKFLGL
jgi:sulfite exporter TauE/SafE